MRLAHSAAASNEPIDGQFTQQFVALSGRGFGIQGDDRFWRLDLPLVRCSAGASGGEAIGAAGLLASGQLAAADCNGRSGASRSSSPAIPTSVNKP